jgi:hypothetical protein
MTDCKQNCRKCSICRKQWPLIAVRRFALSMISATLLITAWYAAKGLAAPTGVAQNIQISSQVAMGMQGVYPETLLQYQEPSTTTAQFSGATTVTIPANTTDNAISVATLFPAFATPVVLGFQDVTSGGVSVSFGLDSGGTKVAMAANGITVIRMASGTPTFYFDNATANDAAIRIFGLSN